MKVYCDYTEEEIRDIDIDLYGAYKETAKRLLTQNVFRFLVNIVLVVFGVAFLMMSKSWLCTLALVVDCLAAFYSGCQVCKHAYKVFRMRKKDYCTRVAKELAFMFLQEIKEQNAVGIIEAQVSNGIIKFLNKQGESAYFPVVASVACVRNPEYHLVPQGIVIKESVCEDCIRLSQDTADEENGVNSGIFNAEYFRE